MPHERFYHLSERVLGIFKRFQSFEAETVFPGPPVQQAYLIWAQTGLLVPRAFAEANGVPMTNQPILLGEAYIVFNDDVADGPRDLMLRNPCWHS